MRDEEGLLWHSPITCPSRISVPRSMVPGVMALVHTTCAHPGIGRKTELTQHKFHWLTYKHDVRDYIISYGCRRRKKSASQRVAMLPARLLQAWEVLEMDTQVMGETPPRETDTFFSWWTGPASFHSPTH